MSFPCELNDLPAQHILSIRTRTPVTELPQALGKAYGEIMAHLTAVGESPAGPPFTCYYNMDMDDLEIDIGFPIAGELPGKGDIQANVIPAGKYATSLYTGPYEGIGAGYDALTQFVKEAGFTPSGIAYEYYLNDPGEVPKEKLVTRIVLPLQ